MRAQKDRGRYQITKPGEVLKQYFIRIRRHNINICEEVVSGEITNIDNRK